jgi:hypothetical protein
MVQQYAADVAPLVQASSRAVVIEILVHGGSVARASGRPHGAVPPRR